MTNNTMEATNHYLRKFRADVSGIDLPGRFTFPFYYTPHPLANLAAKELQEELKTREDWNRRLGYGEEVKKEAEGKMFGVLVVQTLEGTIAYLAAFSGKIAESNHHPGFVPPVFDILQPGGFFRKEEANITRLNQQVEALERDPAYEQARLTVEQLEREAEVSITRLRQRNKAKKAERDRKRAAAKAQMTTEAYRELDRQLRQESAILDRALKS
jgi:tRNA pseudouridine32 synthase/23S rRNA pseudouridine746 synthase